MIYLICFIVSVLCFSHSEKKLKKKQTKRYYLWCCIGLFFPSALAGLRDYTIGTDVLLYGNFWFDHVKEVSGIKSYILSAKLSDIGAGYAVINYMVATVFPDLHFFYFLLNLFVNIFVYISAIQFRGKISIPFAMLTYYFLFYNESLNLLRQSLAISISLFALVYACKYLIGNSKCPELSELKNATLKISTSSKCTYIYIRDTLMHKTKLKNYIIFAMLVCIAVSIHISALICLCFLPILWISKLNNKRFVTLVFCFFCLVLVLFFDKLLLMLVQFGFLSDRYFVYLRSDVAGGRIIRTFYSVIFFGIAVALHQKLVKFDEASSALINCSALSLAFTFLLYKGIFTDIIRISYYFDISQVILFPMFTRKLFLEYNKRKVSVQCCLIILLLVRWWLIFVYQNNGNTSPYVFAEL